MYGNCEVCQGDANKCSYQREKNKWQLGIQKDREFLVTANDEEKLASGLRRLRNTVLDLY